jgi:hypothetical protein
MSENRSVEREPDDEPSKTRLALVTVVGLVLLGAERATPVTLRWISSFAKGLRPDTALLVGIAIRTAWLGLAALAARALGVTRARMGLVSVAIERRREVFAITLGTLVLGLALARLPGVRETYPLYAPARTSLGGLALSTAVFGAYAFTWELYFRGLWVFTLGGAEPSRRRTVALVVHALLFTLAHLEKPAVEVWLAFPGALVAAAYALRARSMLAPFAAHVALAFGVNLAAR